MLRSGLFWVLLITQRELRRAIRYRVFLLEYHSLICNASGGSYALSMLLRRASKFAFLLCLVLTIGLDTGAVFPKAPAKMENTKQEGV